MSAQGSSRREALLGGAIIAVLVAGVILTIFLGDIVQRRTSVFTFVGVVDEAARVSPGTPVWLAGNPVGEVRTVDFLEPREGAGHVAITMAIPAALASLVRADATLELGPDQPLGPPVARIEPGTPAAPPLGQGDTLTVPDRKPMDPVIARARSLVGGLDSVTSRLDALAGQLERQQVSLVGIEPSARAAARELARTQALLSEGPLSAAGTETLRVQVGNLSVRAGELMAALDTLRLRWGGGAGFDMARLRRQAAAVQMELAVLEQRIARAEGTVGRAAHDTALAAAVVRARLAADSLAAEIAAAPWTLFF